jgi:predicted  nucleic acid-binding Zn-ribbon protein
MSPASQGETLLKLVELDRLLLLLMRQLEALPQRPRLSELDATLGQLVTRSEQVAKLRLRQELSIKALRDEEQTLKEKIDESQRQIELNSSKYKEVALLVAEIESLTKRAEKASFDANEQRLGIEKINTVERQLTERITQASAKRSELSESLAGNVAKLEEQAAKLLKQRARLIDQIPAKLAERYDRQRELKQGIGAAALEGRICGACHIELTEGQLARAKREADDAGVGVCPSCLRLLVL